MRRRVQERRQEKYSSLQKKQQSFGITIKTSAHAKKIHARMGESASSIITLTHVYVHHVTLDGTVKMFVLSAGITMEDAGSTAQIQRGHLVSSAPVHKGIP